MLISTISLTGGILLVTCIIVVIFRVFICPPLDIDNIIDQDDDDEDSRPTNFHIV